jgi:hypothetical protein
MGVGEDETLGDAISVTIIATGFNKDQQSEIVSGETSKIIHLLENEQESKHELKPNVTIKPKYDLPLKKFSLEDEVEEEKKMEETYNSLSRNERIKVDKQEEKNKMKLGINEIIVVEPKVFSYRGSKGFDPMKSEEIESTYSEVIESTAKELGVSAYPIDRRTLSDKGTIGFNERNLLISFLSQIAVEDNINIFPVDYQLLKEIEQNYGTKKVMFTLVEHAKSVDINWWMVLGSMVIYPTFPFVLTMHIPMAIFNSNETELNVLILDLEKGLIESGNSYNFNEPIYKHNLGAHVYDIFSKLNQKPQ